MVNWRVPRIWRLNSKKESSVYNGGGKYKPSSEAEKCRYRVVVVGDGHCGKTSLIRRYCCDHFPDHYTPTLFDTETASFTVNGKQVELMVQDTGGQEDLDRLRPALYLSKDIVVICFDLHNPLSLRNVQTLWGPEVKKFCGGVPVILVGNKADLVDTSTQDGNCLRLCAAEDTGCDQGTDSLQVAYRKASEPETLGKDSDTQISSVTPPVHTAANAVYMCLKETMKRMAGCDTLIQAEGPKVSEGSAVAAKIGAVAYFETSAKSNSGLRDVFQTVVSSAMSANASPKKKRR